MAKLNLRTPNSYDGQPGTKYKMGAVRLATDAEAAAGVADNVAVTPAQMTASSAADFAAPPAIGNTTPNAGTFTNLTVNDLLSMDGGAATDFIGTATLVAGTVTVANTNIAAGDRILLCHGAVNASTEVGVLQYTISAGASFTINSLDPTDATVATGDLSTISYVIVRQV